MSHVTNIIITFPIGTPEYPKAMQFVNDRMELTLGKSRAFVDCDKIAGGDKHLSMEVWIGAHNHLDLAVFENIIREAPWGDIQNVRIYIADQEDAFREFKIAGFSPD